MDGSISQWLLNSFCWACLALGNSSSSFSLSSLCFMVLQYWKTFLSFSQWLQTLVCILQCTFFLTISPSLMSVRLHLPLPRWLQISSVNTRPSLSRDACHRFFSCMFLGAVRWYFLLPWPMIDISLYANLYITWPSWAEDCALSWWGSPGPLASCLHSASHLVFTIDLPFCGPNKVDNFFCDLPLVIKLVCLDTYVLEILVLTSSGLLSLICFLLLLISYTIILATVHRQASGGTSRALSTLSAHITVVVLFFGPLIFIYIWPFESFTIDKFISVFFTVFTPLLNPMIYTLRNKDVKEAMKKLRNQHVGSKEAF